MHPARRRHVLSLAVLIAVTFVASSIAAATKDPSPTTTAPDASVALAVTTTTSVAATTTTLPPPPRLHLLRHTANEPLAVEAVDVAPDGSGLRTSPLPPVALRQVTISPPAAVVRSEVLAQRTTHAEHICTPTQCRTYRDTETEAGLTLSAMDGSGETQVTKGGYDTYPSFSPAGTLILFRQNVSEFRAVPAIVGRDGTPLWSGVELGGNGLFFVPTWSPDGNFIAAVHRPSDRMSLDIAIIDWRANTMRTLFARTDAQRLEGLAWTPDGRRLMVTQEDGGHASSAYGDQTLWSVPVDGSRPTVLASLPLAGGYVPTCAGAKVVAWSFFVTHTSRVTANSSRSRPRRARHPSMEAWSGSSPCPSRAADSASSISPHRSTADTIRA